MDVNREPLSGSTMYGTSKLDTQSSMKMWTIFLAVVLAVDIAFVNFKYRLTKKRRCMFTPKDFSKELSLSLETELRRPARGKLVASLASSSIGVSDLHLPSVV